MSAALVRFNGVILVAHAIGYADLEERLKRAYQLGDGRREKATAELLASYEEARRVDAEIGSMGGDELRMCETLARYAVDALKGGAS